MSCLGQIIWKEGRKEFIKEITKIDHNPEVTLFKALWVALPTRAESRLSILAVASLGLSAKDALSSLMG